MSFGLPLRLVRTASFGLALLYATLLAASAVILGFIVYATVQASVDRQMDARIEAEIEILNGEFRILEKIGTGGIDRSRVPSRPAADDGDVINGFGQVCRPLYRRDEVRQTFDSRTGRGKVAIAALISRHEAHT